MNYTTRKQLLNGSGVNFGTLLVYLEGFPSKAGLYPRVYFYCLDRMIVDRASGSRK